MKNIRINFIPGLGEKPNEYKALSKYLNIVDIDWNNGKTKLGKLDTLVGFSLGCIVACMHAEKSHVRRLVLCSLTPEENLGSIKVDEVVFIVGENEKFVLTNVRRIYKNLKCKKSIVIVKGAGHKIDTNYQNTLLKVLGVAK